MIADPRIAARVLQHVRDAGACLMAANAEQLTHDDPVEVAARRAEIGTIMGAMYVRMLEPIVEMYPELKPPEWGH